MRAPTGPLPVVHAPLRARRTIRSRCAVALRGYPRDFGNPGPIRGAIHRRSTTRRTRARPRRCEPWVRRVARRGRRGSRWTEPADPSSATAPVRPAAGLLPAAAAPGVRGRENETPRGTAASLPIHRPPCKHGSRLADASTGGISRFSRPLWARRNVSAGCTPPKGTYPRLSKFGGRFRPRRPHLVHERSWPDQPAVTRGPSARRRRGTRAGRRRRALPVAGRRCPGAPTSPWSGARRSPPRSRR